MTAPRATVSAVAAVLAGALLVIVLVTWAASIGPSGVLRGDGIEPDRATSAPPSNVTPSQTDRPSDGQRVEQRVDRGDHPWVRALALLVELATLCLVLYLLYRLAGWLREAYDARRRRDPRPEEIEFDVLEPPRAVTREILRDSERQRQLLTGGVPGDAIVACWHRFETQADAAGMSRHVWETSSEFTLRILELAAAEAGAVARLAGLYREARFSEHEMTEADRDAATEALDRIHRGLRQPAGSRP
jgi:hypothetical protein